MPGRAALKASIPSSKSGLPCCEIGVRVPPGADPRPDTRLIRRAVSLALRQHQCRAARISIALVDDAGVAGLNRRYRGHDWPTDVLSFDLSAAEDGAPLEGEIVVSWETAAREAARRGHSIQAEALLYVVHGVLHLLGYYDRTVRGAARMHAEEDRLLTRLGFGAVYATARA